MLCVKIAGSIDPCTGIFLFAAIVLFIGDTRENPSPSVVTYIRLGLAGLQVILSVIVPHVIASGHRKRIAAGTWKSQPGFYDKTDTDEGKLAVAYRTATSVGCGILDGAALLALITYLLQGHIANLIVAALILIGVAWHMPLDDRVTAWVENQLQIINDDRQFLR